MTINMIKITTYNQSFLVYSAVDVKNASKAKHNKYSVNQQTTSLDVS